MDVHLSSQISQTFWEPAKGDVVLASYITKPKSKESMKNASGSH